MEFIYYFIIPGFFPTLFWLFYYYRKDLHPEPKLYVFVIFILGGLASIPILIFQIFLSCIIGDTCIILKDNYLWKNPYIETFIFIAFSIIIYAFIEEYFKYAVVRDFVINKKYFDEPIDAIMYMIFSALGFATVENMLFILQYAKEGVSGVSEFYSLLFFRFFTANLVHITSSGILGYFLAKSLMSKNHLYHHFVRKTYIKIGLFFATILHSFYNILIIMYNKEPGNFIIQKGQEGIVVVAIFLLIIFGIYILGHLIEILNRKSLKSL